MNAFFQVTIVISCALLTACGGGDNTKQPTPQPVPPSPEPEPFQLRKISDPTAGFSHRFGTELYLLDDGNLIIVEERGNNRVVAVGGIHFLRPGESKVFQSQYGDDPYDSFGFFEDNHDPTGIVYTSQIRPLNEQNVAVASLLDDVNGIMNAGSIMLIDKETGLQAGERFEGQHQQALIGRYTAALATGNLVVSSPVHVGGNTGTVFLIDGVNGTVIGEPVTGTLEGDQVGLAFDAGKSDLQYKGIIPLASGNYFVLSSTELGSVSGSMGTVRLMNGNNGQQIGSTVEGIDVHSWHSQRAIRLENDNLIVASHAKTEGQDSVQSLRLIDGQTGIAVNDNVGDMSIKESTELSISASVENRYFAITSDTEQTSIALFNASTGAQELNTLSVGSEHDSVAVSSQGNLLLLAVNQSEQGVLDTNLYLFNAMSNTIHISNTINLLDSPYAKVKALNNGHFLLSNVSDNDGRGYLALINGENGEVIREFRGEVPNQYLGRDLLTVFENNRILTTTGTSKDMLVHQGSLMLIDGNSGEIINTFMDLERQDLNSWIQAVELDQSSFALVVPSFSSEELNNRGALWQFSSQDASQLGDVYLGDHAFDRIGLVGVNADGPEQSIFTVGENYLLLISSDDNSGDPNQAGGSAILLNRATNSIAMDPILGEANGAFRDFNLITDDQNNRFILALPNELSEGFHWAGVVFEVEYK